MTTKSMKRLLLTGTALGLANLTPAAAQTSDAAAADEGQIGDIIVTAQKRDERLQDVPVAVAVATGDQLAAIGVESSVDLRIAVPSLNSTAASGYVANSIRGVGALGFAPGIESPVGLYIDGVYIAAPQASELSLNNIASVEVLKGPQGTLFGRNATGGLINIKTKTPGQTTEGKFSLSYGNLGTLTGSAYLGGGLAENLAADIAVNARTRDGFGKNVPTGTDVGSVHHDISLRSKIVWTPSNETTVTATGAYWDGRDTNGWFVEVPGKRNGFNRIGSVPGGFPGFPGPVAIDRGYDASTNFETVQDGWSALGALKIEHDFGGVNLTSTSSYREGKLFLTRDLDYTSTNAANLVINQGDEQISQELQLSSTGNSQLKWTAGLFYFYLKSGYNPGFIDLVNTSFAGVFLTVKENQTANSYAGYGQATYAIGESTNITLGGRYTSEKRAAVDAFQNVFIPFIPPAGLNIPTDFPDRSINANRFTYRISLDHRFSPELLMYASYNTGFKSGGFNTGAPGAPSYNPEKIKAAEIGAKMDLFDRKLRLNLAVFHYDYSDIQVQRVDLFNLLVFNGAKAKVKGIDGDFTAVLSPNFSLTGGFTWLDPKFKDFNVCPISAQGGGEFLVASGPGTAFPTGCTGNQIPFAAKFTGSVAANYTAPLGNGKLLLSGNVYYNSGYSFESDNVLRQPKYAKVGASAKWTSDSGLSIGAYGRNLTQKRTALFEGSQSSGNTAVAWADPREYGVTLGFEF